MSPVTDVGFFGKLPSHGDFLRRRVGDAFVSPWDAWLQSSVAASRAALGQRWLELYLTSPAWRFACAPGACGPSPVAGVMVPSVDRVGRYFPLTIVVALPADANVVQAATAAHSFFGAAEQVAIDVLAAEEVDFEAFDRRVQALSAESARLSMETELVLDAGSQGLLGEASGAPWRIPLRSALDFGQALEQAAASRLTMVHDPLVLFWTDGSAAVEASGLVSKGLPPPETFVALLDGAWAERQWRTIAGRRVVGLTSPTSDAILGPTKPLEFRSAAATDRGPVREINQDAFLERTDVGLWIVADGLGGHSQGEVASRLVCDAMIDVVTTAGLDEMVDSARERLTEVNDQLSRASTRLINPVDSGSTVVAFMVRGRQGVVLWAGDSRAYRWRAGTLEQLTTDHSADDPGHRGSTAITRAVGAEPELDLDLRRDPVEPGDRFLLCSDGLYRGVTGAEIAAWLARPSVSETAEGLVKAALDGGTRDNVTALVIEAYE